ncbi:hypothetical protein POVWA2_025340 [Plasmodium ovale wallikeri]|uniref:Uncharacterized protein n=1 Tax=Plasmodium ovale wallikeri TaxID=864142 RepID=A0A1A8YU49_PLAOA|nr:hypothetical protein POVWA1_025510 [Plasmodium ovale wallikeri]SBT35490.1 hypothetical protein POVWA2_025340 [Plasmodium ovale wallikeri]
MCICSGHLAAMLRIDKYNYNAGQKTCKYVHLSEEKNMSQQGGHLKTSQFVEKGIHIQRGVESGASKANVTGKERHEKEIKCKVIGDK